MSNENYTPNSDYNEPDIVEIVIPTKVQTQRTPIVVQEIDNNDTTSSIGGIAIEEVDINGNSIDSEVDQVSIEINTKINDAPFPKDPEQEEKDKLERQRKIEELADMAFKQTLKDNTNNDLSNRLKEDDMFNPDVEIDEIEEFSGIEEVLSSIEVEPGIEEVEMDIDIMELPPVEEKTPVLQDTISVSTDDEEEEYSISDDIINDIETIEPEETVVEDKDPIEYELDEALSDFPETTKEELNTEEPVLVTPKRKYNYEQTLRDTKLNPINAITFSGKEAVEIMEEVQEILSLDPTNEERISLEKTLSNPMTVEAQTLIASTNFLTSGQDFNEQRVNDRLEEYPENIIASIAEYNGKKYGHSKAGKNSIKSIASGTVISNKDTIARTLAAITSGIRRVHLYSSGFWVELKAPGSAELMVFELECNLQSSKQEWGRILGGTLYAYSDLQLKKSAINLIKSCIVGSNLANYTVDDVLEENLSILDLETCLWGLSTLMFPKGTDVDFMCFSPTCKHVDTVLINLQHAIHTDYTRLGNEALVFTHEAKSRSTEELVAYREGLKLTSKYNLDDAKTWSATITIPTVKEVFKFGDEFITKMIQMIHIDNITDVSAYVFANEYSTFLPYIKYVSYTSEDGREIIFDGAGTPLDALATETTIDLVKALEKHITNSTISFFGYPYTACPKCNVPPKHLKHSSIPIDMMSTFFTMVEVRKDELLA